MDTGSGRACLGVRDRGVGGERLPDGQLVRADSQTCASRRYGLRLRQTHVVRPCEVRVLRRQHADGDPPPGRRPRLLRHQLDVIQKLVSVAVGAPDVAQAEQPGQRRRQRRRRHSGERRTGAHVGDHAAAVDQRAMIDKQGNRRLQPEEILERRGPPGHTDPAAPTPSGVRQIARLMSITRPPNGARRFASSKGSFAP